MTHRGAAWVSHPFGLWDAPSDDKRGIAWTRRAVAELKPYDVGSTYLNVVADVGDDDVRASSGRRITGGCRR